MVEKLPPEPGPLSDDDYVSVKIKRGTQRLLVTVASWKRMPMMTYLDEFVKKHIGPDLEQMQEQMQKQLEELGKYLKK
jgi:hypothetical protein